MSCGANFLKDSNNICFCPPSYGYDAIAGTCTLCNVQAYSTSINSTCISVPANATRTLDGTYFYCNPPLTLSGDGKYCTSLNDFADPLQLTTFNINESLSYFCPVGSDSNTCAIQHAHITNALPLLYSKNAPVKIESYLFPTQVQISGSIATLTSNAHGLLTGSNVHLSGFGNSALNGGPFKVTVTDSDHFTLPTNATGTSTLGLVTVDTLPTKLLSNLASCVSSNTCNYLGYDFLSDSTRQGMNVTYVVDTSQTGGRDASVFIKSNMPKVTILSSPPGYTYSANMASYVSSLAPVTLDIDQCAVLCNATNGCLGFNHDEFINACQLITGSLQVNTDQNSTYIGYTKEIINHFTIPAGTNLSLINLTNEANLCMDYRQCNFDMNVLVYSNVGTFTTNDLESCAYCPLRSYEGSLGTGQVTNEVGTVTVNPVGLLTQLMFQAGTFTVPFLTDGGYTVSPWIQADTHITNLTTNLPVFVYHNLLFYKDTGNKLYGNIPLVPDQTVTVEPTTYIQNGYVLRVAGQGIITLTSTSPYYVIEDVDLGTADYNHGIFIFTPRPDSVGSFFTNVIGSNTYVTDSDGGNWSIRLGAPNFTTVSQLLTSITFDTTDPACQNGSVTLCEPTDSVFITNTTGLQTGSQITIKNQNFTVLSVRSTQELTLGTNYVQGITSNITYGSDTIVQTSFLSASFPVDRGTSMLSFYNDIQPQSPLNASSVAAGNQLLGVSHRVDDMPDPYEPYGLFRSLYLSPRSGAYTGQVRCDQHCDSYVAYNCYVRQGAGVTISCDIDAPGYSLGTFGECDGTYKKCTPDKTTLLNSWSRVYSNLIPVDIFNGVTIHGLNSQQINSTDVQNTRWSTVYSIATYNNPDSLNWGTITIDANGNFSISNSQPADYFFSGLTVILSASTSSISLSGPQKQYTIGTTNGTSTFQLLETSGASVSTTPGTLTGVTFSLWEYGSIRNDFLDATSAGDFPFWSQGRFNNQAGFQNTTGFLESPFGCPAGYYVMARNNINYCEVCPAGTYSFGGHTRFQCTPCTLGHYCQKGSTHDGPQCAPGYYCPDPATQYSCPAGYYCPQGTVFPISCDTQDTKDGTFTSVTGTVTLYADSPNTIGFSANPNFLPATIATLTPLLGSLQLLSNTVASSIFKVILDQNLNAVGTGPQTLSYHTQAHFCPIGSSTARLCEASNYCPFSRFEIPCSSGNYCPVGVYKGYPCPAGTYYRAPQLSKVNVGQLNADGSHCYQCPYSVVGDPTSPRLQVNATQDGCLCGDPNLAWSLEEELCILNCPPGQFANTLSNRCENCPPGTFSNAYAQAQCVQCPDNFQSTVNSSKTGCICTNTRHDGKVINGTVVWNNTYNRCQMTSCAPQYTMYWSDCVPNTKPAKRNTTYTCKDAFNNDRTTSSDLCFDTYCANDDNLSVTDNGNTLICWHPDKGDEYYDACPSDPASYWIARLAGCGTDNCRSGYHYVSTIGCIKTIAYHCPQCWTVSGFKCVPATIADVSCFTCPYTNVYVPTYDANIFPHTSINDFISNPTLPLTFGMGWQTNGVPDTLGMYFQYNPTSHDYTRIYSPYTPSDAKITDLIELAGVFYATNIGLTDMFQILTNNNQTLIERLPDLNNRTDALASYAALKTLSNLLEIGELSYVTVNSQLYSNLPTVQGQCPLLVNIPPGPSLWGEDGSTPRTNPDHATNHNLLLALQAVFTGAAQYSVYFNPGRDGTEMCYKGFDCQTGDVCPAGYYCGGLIGSTKNICPRGYRCPQGTSEPIPCTTGTYCPFGSSVELDCPAGSYCPTSLSNIYCPSGTYNNLTRQTSISACIQCPDGSYAPSGSISCTPCSVGSYCVSTVIGRGESRDAPCPENYFCPNTTTRLGCPAGYGCPEGSTWTHNVCARNQQNVYNQDTKVNTCTNCLNPAPGQIWDSSYWTASGSSITFPLTNNTVIKINATASADNTSNCLLKTVIVSNVASGAKFTGFVDSYTADKTMTIKDIPAFSGPNGTYSVWTVNLAGCHNIINCEGHATNNPTWTQCVACTPPTLDQVWVTNSGCSVQNCQNGRFSSLTNTSTGTIPYPISAPLVMGLNTQMTNPFRVGSQVLVYNAYNTSFVGTVSICDGSTVYFNEIRHRTTGKMGYNSWTLQQYGCA
jgi:Tyrosine-protein kinase ephrin type A/B receptor-like